ncbi:hypothetical protein C5167_050289 [Papaver somniferum]|uniref:Uncharacterized protein n=1 Tax=Papaver somniferum TaxID=3469 RepID=A0A4Y7KSE6_PAPSO|nr:hypothetical protein C5167_050289 [Papaver somniferum]
MAVIDPIRGEVGYTLIKTSSNVVEGHNAVQAAERTDIKTCKQWRPNLHSRMYVFMFFQLVSGHPLDTNHGMAWDVRTLEEINAPAMNNYTVIVVSKNLMRSGSFLNKLGKLTALIDAAEEYRYNMRRLYQVSTRKCLSSVGEETPRKTIVLMCT